MAVPFIPNVYIAALLKRRKNNKQLLKTLRGKEEIARYEQFLLFPQCFLLNQITATPIAHNFDMIYLFTAELEEPKICI